MPEVDRLRGRRMPAAFVAHGCVYATCQRYGPSSRLASGAPRPRSSSDQEQETQRHSFSKLLCRLIAVSAEFLNPASLTPSVDSSVGSLDAISSLAFLALFQV